MAYTDAFTGTNGTALATYNANWTVDQGGFEIQSNQLASNNSAVICMARYSGGTFGDNHYSQLVYTAPSGAASGVFGVGTRLTATKNGYAFVGRGDFGATDSFMYRIDAGVSTSLGSNAAQFSANDVMYLSSVGTTHTAKQNTTTVFTVTDATYSTGGFAGIISDNLNSTTILIDTWESGDIVVSGKVIDYSNFPKMKLRNQE